MKKIGLIIILLLISITGYSKQPYKPKFHFGDEVKFFDEFYLNCEGRIDSFDNRDNSYRITWLVCNRTKSDPIWIKGETLTKKE